MCQSSSRCVSTERLNATTQSVPFLRPEFLAREIDMSSLCSSLSWILRRRASKAVRRCNEDTSKLRQPELRSIILPSRERLRMQKEHAFRMQKGQSKLISQIRPDWPVGAVSGGRALVLCSGHVSGDPVIHGLPRTRQDMHADHPG